MFMHRIKLENILSFGPVRRDAHPQSVNGLKCQIPGAKSMDSRLRGNDEQASLP